MAMTGMLAFTNGRFEYGGEYTTHSWTIEIEPANAFAQVFLADFWEMDDESSAQVGFSQVTHRKSNGKDKVISFASNFNNMDTGDIVRIIGDDRLSSVTVKMGFENIYAMWMLQIFCFD